MTCKKLNFFCYSELYNKCPTFYTETGFEIEITILNFIKVGKFAEISILHSYENRETAILCKNLIER